MIDPNNITNYNLSDKELQEVLCFWILVAGKPAKVIAPRLEGLLNSLQGNSPFEKILSVDQDSLAQMIHEQGIGCHKSKARSLHELAKKGLDLKTCSSEDLEAIYGIGMKTSRCFIIHSRENAPYAGLDTHILKFLRSKGHDAPKSTPTSQRAYRALEKVFLRYAKEAGMTVADFDLSIWKELSQKTA